MRPAPPVKWVSEETIRSAFNRGQHFEKAGRGEILARLLRESHVRRPPPGEPVCTMSQVLEYLDLAGGFIAVVHQYLRPDNRIGASGRPDPKRLKIGDAILAVRQAPGKTPG